VETCSSPPSLLVAHDAIFAPHTPPIVQRMCCDFIQGQNFLIRCPYPDASACTVVDDPHLGRLGLDGPEPPIDGVCHRDILGFLEISLLNFSILNLRQQALYGIALIALKVGGLPGHFPATTFSPDARVASVVTKGQPLWAYAAFPVCLLRSLRFVSGVKSRGFCSSWISRLCQELNDTPSGQIPYKMHFAVAKLLLV
jgi:hypothetical protein